MNAEITVVIPTLAEERRGATLWRAIESAGPRSGASTRVLVVVNGERFSPSLVQALEAAPGIECARLATGSLPLAIRAGRERVASEFFAFLDDDDEILEGGLGTRLKALSRAPEAAFLATGGWRRGPGGDAPMVSRAPEAIEADPLGSLLVENWLASCGGLYRSACVTAADFVAMPAYLEWTWLAFRLASRLPFRFLAEPTFRVHDSPDSVSKSRAYSAGMVSALEAILALELPVPVRRGLARKLAAAHHGLATLELEEGGGAAAWRHHWQSLLLPGGLRYLSFTRHLLRSPARRKAHG